MTLHPGALAVVGVGLGVSEIMLAVAFIMIPPPPSRLRRAPMAAIFAAVGVYALIAGLWA